MIQNDYLDMSIRYNMFKCSLKVIKYKNNWLSEKKKTFVRYSSKVFKLRTAHLQIPDTSGIFVNHMIFDIIPDDF